MALAKRSNTAGPPLQAPCRPAPGRTPRTASHLEGPGTLGLRQSDLGALSAQSELLTVYAAGLGDWRRARAEHAQAKATGAQIIHFLLQIRRGERMLLEPARRKAHFQRAR